VLAGQRSICSLRKKEKHTIR